MYRYSSIYAKAENAPIQQPSSGYAKALNLLFQTLYSNEENEPR